MEPFATDGLDYRFIAEVDGKRGVLIANRCFVNDADKTEVMTAMRKVMVEMFQSQYGMVVNSDDLDITIEAFDAEAV